MPAIPLNDPALIQALSDHSEEQMHAREDLLNDDHPDFDILFIPAIDTFDHSLRQLEETVQADLDRATAALFRDTSLNYTYEHLKEKEPEPEKISRPDLTNNDRKLDPDL